MAQEKKTAKVPTTFTPKFIENVDGRFGVAKALRARYEALKADTDAESTQRDLLCRRAVFLSVILETAESEAMESGKIDLGSYVQGCNSLMGVLKCLGLEKRVQSVTDLKTYLAEKRTR